MLPLFISRLLVTFLSMWLLVACGVAQSATPDSTATPVDDTLLVYTASRKELYEPYLTSFKAEHPDIKIEVINDSTSKITEKFLAEKGDPQADVIWAVAATSLLRAATEGMLEPYAPQGLNRVNLKMRDSNDPPLLVGLYVYMSAFCVNTAELTARGLPMPTSWADLANPIYKNSLVMPDPSISGTGYLAVAAFLQLMGEEKGWAYMNALHDNITWYTRSGSAPCGLAAEGKVPIGISFGEEAARQRLAGHPIEAVFPQEGSGWEMDAVALVRKNVIKPEAKVFLDWAISDNAMRAYAHNFPVTSVPTDVPLPDGYTAEPLKQLIQNWRFLWITANHARITTAWVERYGSKSEGQGAEIPDAFK